MVIATRHAEFEPYNDIGIYLRVRKSSVFQRHLCFKMTIDESLFYSKVDSYVVWRLKPVMSGCSENGHTKYNERRRSESLESQLQLRQSIRVSEIFACDLHDKRVLVLAAVDIQEI